MNNQQLKKYASKFVITLFSHEKESGYLLLNQQSVTNKLLGPDCMTMKLILSLSFEEICVELL